MGPGDVTRVQILGLRYQLEYVCVSNFPAEGLIDMRNHRLRRARRVQSGRACQFLEPLGSSGMPGVFLQRSTSQETRRGSRDAQI